MKIMLISDSMGIGGAETHVFALAKELFTRGYSVAIVSKHGQLAERILYECRGVRFYDVFPKGRRPHHIAEYVLRLGAIIKKEAPTVIHAHSRITAFAVRTLRPCLKNTPFIVTAHAKYRKSVFLGIFSSWGDKCIAVSEDIKSHLINRYGVGEDKITLIPNGVDTDEFCPGEHSSSHTLLFASRLDSDCSLGAKCLCQIANTLALEYRDARIIIAGGGSELGKIKTMARGNDRISFLGTLDSLSDAIGEADAVIGVSRVALEGMASEKNVILFGDEGALGLLCDENIKNAETTNFTCRGFGVKDKDFLLGEIRRLFDMTGRERDDLAKNNRAYVMKNHSACLMVNETLQVYQSALASGHRIVVGGYYGFKNIGDEMLKTSLLTVLNQTVSDARVCVLNKTKISEAGVRYVNRYSPVLVMRELIRADVFILGGGSLLQNSTSNRSLVYYCALVLLAKLLGCKTILLSNGLGPLDGKFAECIVSLTLGRADKVSVRDETSLALAKRLGREDTTLTADLCFSFELPLCESKKGDEIKSLAKNGYVLIAMKGDGRYDHKPLVEELCCLCQSRGLLPVFVAMDESVDSKLSKNLAALSGGVFVECEGFDDILSLISDAWVVLGERLHFLIFALAMGRGFVGIGEMPKIKSFVKETLGIETLNIHCPYQLTRLIDAARSFSSAELLSIYERQKRRSDVGLVELRDCFFATDTKCSPKAIEK